MQNTELEWEEVGGLLLQDKDAFNMKLVSSEDHKKSNNEVDILKIEDSQIEDRELRQIPSVQPYSRIL